MAILVDYQIRKLLSRGVVSSYDPNCVNPASLNLRLGAELLEEVPPPFWLRLLWRFYPNLANRLDTGERWKTVDLTQHTPENPYWVYPRRFILVDSMESFNMPRNLAAQVQLRSTAGRMGLDHGFAGYCDPGWHGSKLTKEMTNLLRWRPIPIWYGMEVVQLIFHQTADEPDRDYSLTGQYNGDRGVSAAKEL